MPEASPNRRAFLNVARSARGRPWRARLDPAGEATALAMVQRHGVSDILARILAGRAVPVDALPAYLEPTIKATMPDPSVVTDMDAAAARLADACTQGERVAIFGDYDVDGAASAALLAGFLRRCGLDPLIHIPDRLFEGYGPNVDAIAALAQRGARLLVTVDCGTTSADALVEAARRGLDTVVIDHHQAPEALPAVHAIVNPNRADDLSGLGHLAACGLVFLTLVAVSRELRRRDFWSAARPEPDLMASLDLVALGTVADVVPLKGLNRAYVARGLAALRRRERPGLVALMDVARLAGPPQPWHLGFLVGPRINAGGRIGDAGLGARLLLTDDTVEAARIAAELDRLNAERQAIERETVAQAEAEALAALGIGGRAPVVVVGGERWHPGVMGLVAARLKESFARPAFAIAWGPGGEGTGSGRSIAGVDLGHAVRAAVAEGIVVKGGGHAMAAGVTLRKDRLAEFRAFLEARLSEAVEAARERDALAIDAALVPRAANASLLAEIDRAGPFGSGNPDPVFAISGATVAFADIVGQQHVRARLRGEDGAMLDAIAFRAATEPHGKALIAARGTKLHVAGTLALESWQGRDSVRLRVLDVADPATG